MRAMANRIYHLEARCNDLQATIDVLIHRIEVLETRTPAPGEVASPVDDIEAALAQAGRGDRQVGGDGPLDVSMVPAPLGEEDGTGGLEMDGPDIPDILIYDEDVRELITMCSEVTPPASEASAAAPDVVQAPDVLDELLAATTTAGDVQAPDDQTGRPAATASADGALGDGTQKPRTAPAPSDDVAAPAAEFAPPREGVLHLILGDSIAAYLDPPLQPGHQLLNLAVRGSTWAREAGLLREHLEEWEREAAERGADLGRIFLWLGGNDVYGRPHEVPRELCERTVSEVLSQLSPYAARTTMAGPTPRLRYDYDMRWECTRAAEANLTLERLAAAHGVHFVRYLGRALSSMVQRQHVVNSAVARHWFAPDGVHLTVQGYQKVLKKLGALFG